MRLLTHCEEPGDETKSEKQLVRQIDEQIR